MINLVILLDDPDFIESVQFSKVKYQPDDIILKENEVSQDVYFILDGQVQISTCIGGEVDRVLPAWRVWRKAIFLANWQCSTANRAAPKSRH